MILVYKDIDHLGCFDCERFSGDIEEGRCKEPKEFCKRHFNAKL